MALYHQTLTLTCDLSTVAGHTVMLSLAMYLHQLPSYGKLLIFSKICRRQIICTYTVCLLNLGFGHFGHCARAGVLHRTLVGWLFLFMQIQFDMVDTSHSAYVTTETELVGAKIDGLLPPNFL